MGEKGALELRAAPPAYTFNPAQLEVLELDELWTFVGNKANPVWLWIALDRGSRQVVACDIARHGRNLMVLERGGRRVHALAWPGTPRARSVRRLVEAARPVLEGERSLLLVACRRPDYLLRTAAKSAGLVELRPLRLARGRT